MVHHVRLIVLLILYPDFLQQMKQVFDKFRFNIKTRIEMELTLTVLAPFSSRILAISLYPLETAVKIGVGDG